MSDTFQPRHGSHVAIWRFGRYQLAIAQQRRQEAQAIALGMALAVVIFFTAMNWATLVMLAAFAVAAM